ncbi:hypothetical protein U3653_17090 [Nocardia sp. CDC186]|uniref:Uncharacterized protein n=1 Tax=Nocardia implantans TaxID=3108168 RepID=A0ABU6AWT4_9NOCA|nr:MULTISPECIES: hypothetical protein [unclassified Nocardia]MEB3511748.1 hypothetical protein [Nocardia sp. CDC186]
MLVERKRARNARDGAAVGGGDVDRVIGDAEDPLFVLADATSDQ